MYIQDYALTGDSLLLTTDSGENLRFTLFRDDIVRISMTVSGRVFGQTDTGIVTSERQPVPFLTEDTRKNILFCTSRLKIEIRKKNMETKFYRDGKLLTAQPYTAYEIKPTEATVPQWHTELVSGEVRVTASETKR